ncbi:MAG: hypothetical protein Q7U06_01330 [Pseudomonadota bacterium]|nr:hypothetical protein [Pseudomonadota bacterium]
MHPLLSAVFFLFVGCAPAVHEQCGVAPEGDTCNYEGCVACAAHCGDECVGLEMNPTAWSCPDGESFTVCPTGG